MPSALWVVVRGVSLGEVPEQKNEKTAECREHSPCRVGEVGLGGEGQQEEREDNHRRSSPACQSRCRGMGPQALGRDGGK